MTSNLKIIVKATLCLAPAIGLIMASIQRFRKRIFARRPVLRSDCNESHSWSAVFSNCGGHSNRLQQSVHLRQGEYA